MVISVNTIHFYFGPEVQCHKSLLLLSYKTMSKYVSEDTTMVVMAFDMIIMYYINFTIKAKVIDEY